MEPLHIAVVEDHGALRELFVHYLRGQNHAAEGVSCAEELDDLLKRWPVDLLVLDINLPGESGYSIAQRLRKSRPGIGIIMLTTRTAEDDRIRGYDSGADLYLPKPVSPNELGAAVGSIRRRLQGNAAPPQAVVLEPARMRVLGPLGEASLGKGELAVLHALAVAPSRRLEHWRLLAACERELNERGKAMLEIDVSRVRKKLLSVGMTDPCIKVVRGEGYQLCGVINVTAE